MRIADTPTPFFSAAASKRGVGGKIRGDLLRSTLTHKSPYPRIRASDFFLNQEKSDARIPCES